MLLNRYQQQPGENLKRIIDYDRWLEVNEEIVTVQATVTPATSPPLVVNNVLIDDDGKQLGYYVSGGMDGTDYTATFSLTTNAGQVREDEIEFEIEEI